MRETPPPIERDLNPAHIHRNKRWSARAASLILPGLGQLISGRVLVGLIQMLFAVAFFGLLLMVIVLYMLAGLRYARDVTYTIELPPFPWLAFAGSVAGVLLIYAWSLWDAGRIPDKNESSTPK